jgi:uncharacterized protein
LIQYLSFRAPGHRNRSSSAVFRALAAEGNGPRNDADKAALSEFASMVREMKNDGVKLEVCSYALEVLGVDPATVLPEVEKVGNGFISVVGYQSQGYSVVTIN